MKKIKMPHMAAFTKMINWHSGYCSFEGCDDFRAEISGSFSIEELKIIVAALKEYTAAEAIKSRNPGFSAVQEYIDNFVPINE
ncbi:MAG: hypothetical protein WCL71_13260 [Deltaproteobacteria bacterium]